MNRLLAGLGVAILAVFVAACSSAGSAAPSGPPASVDPNALQVSAKDVKFSTAQLTAPADEPFTMVFDNQEAVPHNVAIYRDDTLAEKLFGQDPFGGPRTETYSVPALAAGSYVFICDLHREMKGTLTAQ
jgi:plastocyanin